VPRRASGISLALNAGINDSRLFTGDVFHPPRKRPHHRGNPMRDPLVLSGALAPGRARLRPRARDRREFEPVDVHEIRRRFGQTRRQFADMIGISRETLRNWERGRRCPLGPARALLRIAAADPDVVAAALVRHRAAWGKNDPLDDVT
jgi:putative transcriptional regulator